MAKMTHVCALGLTLGLLLTATGRADPPAARIVEVKKIWSAGKHNAFTDLLFHDGHWYCVFREGAGHISPDGAIRVLTSTDGEHWEPAALLTAPDADLRDGKISVGTDGRLLLTATGAWHHPKQTTHQSFIWSSTDGKNWGEPTPIADPGYWVWRIISHGGAEYGLGYETQKKVFGTRLYKSEHGGEYAAIVPQLTGPEQGYSNESGLLVLPDHRMVSVLRRDGGQDSTALLGIAAPPYTEWSWRSLGVRIGGPDMIQLPDGRIIVAGRKYERGATTTVWQLDLDQARLVELATVPSGGDTSYPGLVYHDGQLWMSYYSSHEGKTDIYLARLELPNEPE